MGDTSKKISVQVGDAPVTYERPRILVLGTRFVEERPDRPCRFPLVRPLRGRFVPDGSCSILTCKPGRAAVI